MVRALVLWCRRVRRDTTLLVFVVVSLGLPLGAACAALALHVATIWRALPFHAADQLVKIEARSTGSAPRWLALPELAALSAAPPAPFEAVAGYTVADFTLASEGDVPAQGLLATLVTPGLMPLLGINPMLGRVPDAESYSAAGARVALLSHDLWQRRYGADPGVVGKTIQLSTVDYYRGASGSYRVIGVLPPDLWLFWKRADLVVPLRVEDQQAADVNAGLVEHVLGRLQPDAEVDAARTAGAQMVARLRALGARETLDAIVIGDLARAHFRRQEGPLRAVLAVAAIVVVLAIANVMIAAIADAIRRRRETAIRVALGGAFRRLLMETTWEMSFTMAVAGAFALVVAAVLIAAMTTLVPDSWVARIPAAERAFRVDWWVIGSIVALCGVAAVASSVLVQRLARVRSNWQLLASSTATPIAGSTRLRTGIVAVEVALAVCAVGVGVVLIGELVKLRATDMGVAPAQAAAAWINPDPSRASTQAARAAYFETLIDAVSGHPGVAAAGAIDLPFHFDWEEKAVRPASGTAPPVVEALARAASPGYLDAAGIQLVEGRWFDRGDRSGALPVAVVSRALAGSLFPAGSAIGASMLTDAKDPASIVTVIGIVSDTRHAPHLPPDRILYRPLAQAGPESIYVVARTHAGIDPMKALPEAVWSVNRNQPVDGPWRLQQWVDDRTADLEFVVLFTALLAALGGLMAAAGVYGVAAHWVIESAHELGVRRAIGASDRDVARWLGGRVVRVIVPGAIGGFGLMLLAFRVVLAAVEGVASPDLWQLGAIGLLAALVLMAAATVPMVRALHTTPSVLRAH
jgi:predicted permease